LAGKKIRNFHAHFIFNPLGVFHVGVSSVLPGMENLTGI
jgi:hypothetical protein